MKKPKISLTSDCLKDMKREFNAGLLLKSDIERAQTWVNTVKEDGLLKVQRSAIWRDHTLSEKGKWKDYRSVKLSSRGRLIYKHSKEKGLEIVKVEKITGVHNYDN